MAGTIPFKKKQQFIQRKDPPFDQQPKAENPPQEGIVLAPLKSHPNIDEAVADGHKDYIKEMVKENAKNIDKLDSIAELADFVLFKTKTVNPIDPFPDEVIVDSHKVSIVYNYFFGTGRTHSVTINNISDVFVDTGIFFAKLGIVDKGFVENTVDVEYLSKDDAKKIRRIVQGLVVAHIQGIDISGLKQQLDEAEIIEKIEKLGKARTGEDRQESTAS